MFLHNLIYGIKSSIRDKAQIMWSLVFIIALGTLFKIAFGDIYEQDERLKGLKVAVCIENEDVNSNFDKFVADVSLVDSGENLLDITRTNDMEEAKKLLEDKEVVGVFYSEENELKLLIKKQDIPQSILSSVVTNYHQVITLVSDVEAKNPDKAQQTLLALAAGYGENTQIKNSDSDMDVYAQYFYNLIAMACIMSVSVGTTIAVKNKSNTSILGARKEISGANHFAISIASLIAGALIQTACVIVSFFYLVLIGVNFGDHYLKIFMIMAVGIFAGTSIGYCLGNMSFISYKAKDAIATTVSVGGSFLSGLMIADMRMIMDDVCPIVNKVNPVALVSDSLYAINTFATDDRLHTNLLTLFIIAVVAIVLGNVFGRRKSYASI